MSLLATGWFSLAVLSSFTASIVGVLQKAAIKKTTNPAAFGIYFQMLVGLIGLPMAILQTHSFALNFGIIILLLAMAFFSSCSNLLYYFALKSTEISQAAILTSTSSLWLLLGGFFFLDECMTLKKFGGIFLVLSGIFIIYFNKKSLKSFGAPQICLVISAIFSGMVGIFDKHLIGNFSIFTYQVISYMLQSSVTALMIPASIKCIPEFFKSKKTNFIIVCSAALLNLGSFAYFSSLKIGGEISKINPILQASTILTIIFGIIFFNEREKLFRKFLGASVIFMGVMLIK